jgi:hypothetical protein
MAGCLPYRFGRIAAGRTWVTCFCAQRGHQVVRIGGIVWSLSTTYKNVPFYSTPALFFNNSLTISCEIQDMG